MLLLGEYSYSAHSSQHKVYAQHAFMLNTELYSTQFLLNTCPSFSSAASVSLASWLQLRLSLLVASVFLSSW